MGSEPGLLLCGDFVAACAPVAWTAVAASIMSLNKASAWRVKYRDMKGTQKIRVRIENLGVHECNRGGVYPAGIRCRDLCIEVLKIGFLQEEFTHALVAVEEKPIEQIRQSMDYVSASQYNRVASLQDEHLRTCFDEPYGSVQYKCLSHSHTCMFLRAFLTKAEWKIDPIELKRLEKTIKPCDEQGKLCMTAVAATENGKELVQVIRDGVDCEVLSWKMSEEEPTAAAVISCALNRCSDLAMRTTEWSALYTLKGEIIKAARTQQLNQTAVAAATAELPELFERVAYAQVLDACHVELDSAADDPDLPELFDFLVSLGVGANSYCDDLEAFGKRFVDSKQRQMRFAAFGVLNKIHVAYPWMKIAILKRAYWRPTKSTWCANPEPWWDKLPTAAMDSAEQLLRYVHVTAVAAGWEHRKKTQWLGNVDIAIANALADIQGKHKGKPPVDKAREAMLNCLVNMPGMDLTVFGADPPEGCEWVKFEKAQPHTAEAASTSPTAVAADTEAKVNLLQFNEKTGERLNTQVQFANPEKKSIHMQIPWKDWHEQNLCMGATQADKASVLTLLQNIHHRWDPSSVDVNLMLRDGKISVVAGSKVKKNAIMLPPCVPNKMVVHDANNEHPLAVPITVLLSNNKVKENHTEKNAERVAHFLLCPDFKAPTAVAASSSSKSLVPTDESHDAAVPQLVYSKDHSESLSPFWAVRRITNDALQHEKDEMTKEMKNTGEKQKMPQFNCQFANRVHNCLSVADVGEQCLSSTRFVTVPYITNTKELAEGDELIVQHVPRAKKKSQKKREMSWRDVHQQEMKDSKKKPATKRNKREADRSCGPYMKGRAQHSGDM